MNDLPQRDPRAFIREQTTPAHPPLVPEIALHLASEAVALWQLTEATLERTGLPPPYWAFAWAGGQALARYLLDNPQTVKGKRALDLGAGSGLVAIAAAKCEAREVAASDIDRFACAAIELNAALNRVAIDVVARDLIGKPVGAEIILVGDMCYEKPLAERLCAWLKALAQDGKHVLVGDPGRSYFPRARMGELARYRVPTTRALEDCEFRSTGVFRLGVVGSSD
jgi:predicted nicotinamide N-methyase